MINFFDLEFERVTLHRIWPKTQDTDAGRAEQATELTEVSPNTVEMIQDRLYDAASGLKYFQLAVEDDSESGFYGYAKDLHQADDQKFINYSGKIAELLAESMKTRTIPGGYFLVIQAKTDRTDKKVIIAIKAEVQNAITIDGNGINIIEDIFLSPAKKFLKFGVLFEYNHAQAEEFEEMNPPNDKWGAFMFDQQFRPQKTLSEYFYKDFLGFTSEYNAKIQSHRFYKETEQFIIENVLDLAHKQDMLNVLDYEFTQNTQEIEISPRDFADSYLHDEALNEDYKLDVGDYLPSVIEKDSTLIKSMLFNKKIEFANGVKLSSSKDALDANVEINPNWERLDEIRQLPESFTIVAIKGRPYRK